MYSLDGSLTVIIDLENTTSLTPPPSLVTRIRIDYRHDAGHNGIKPTTTYINNHRKTNLYMSIHRNMPSRIKTTNYKPYKHGQHDTYRYETARDG